MSTTKHDPQPTHTPPPPLHDDPKAVAKKDAKDAPKSPEEQKAEDDEKRTEAERAAFEPKIKSVLDSKPKDAPPPNAVPTYGVSRVYSAAEVGVKGEPTIPATQSAEQKKAQAEYDKKVADLWAEVEKLRVDPEKGPMSPEFLEAHRLMNLAFR